MSKTVLITGATSGIGLACAHQFANGDFNLIICGRRAARLREFQETYQKDNNILTLEFDVRDQGQVIQKINSLKKAIQ